MAHVAPYVLEFIAENAKHNLHAHGPRSYSLMDLLDAREESIFTEFEADQKAHEQAKVRAKLPTEYAKLKFDGYRESDVQKLCEEYDHKLMEKARLWHDQQQEVNAWYFKKLINEEQKSGEIVQLEQIDAYGNRIVHQHIVPPIHSGWFYNNRKPYESNCPICRKR